MSWPAVKVTAKPGGLVRKREADCTLGFGLLDQAVHSTNDVFTALAAHDAPCDHQQHVSVPETFCIADCSHQDAAHLTITTHAECSARALHSSWLETSARLQ